MSPLRRLLPAALLLPLLAVSARADQVSDALRTYKKEMGRITARQKNYEAKALDQELRDAHTIYRAPWRESGKPGAPKVINNDYTGYEGVYERWAHYETEKGELALNLADVAGKKIAERLVATLLDVLTGIVKEEAVLAQSKPKSRYLHDLGPGMRRYALWLHRDAIVRAVSKLADPEALEYLIGKGWEKAGKWGKSKKSPAAQIALLDGLGMGGVGSVRSFLAQATESKAPRLRIAGLQGLARFPDSKEWLAERLRAAAEKDPCFAVRRTAKILLGEKKGKGDEGEPRHTFCGVGTNAKSVVLLLDTASLTVKPLDVEMAAERTYREWRSIAEKDRDFERQIDFLIAEARGFVGALPDGDRFNLLELGGSSTITPFWPKGMATASEAVRRKAVAFVDEIVEGGWAPQLAGIREAYRLAGADPWKAETPDEPQVEAVFLLSNGELQGGTLMFAPAILDDVVRRHRFQRIPIHTILVGDRDEPAQTLMRGIADITGGTYVMKKKP